MPLLILNKNLIEPSSYLERKTVKAVIINDYGNTLHLSSNLIGGGVEEGENYEVALHREALEEAGIKIEIIKLLGEVIQYRDVLKKKYIVYGYLCKFINASNQPDSIDKIALNSKIIWEKPQEAINRFQSEINILKNTDPNKFEGDMFQSKLYNRQMALAFLEEAFNN